MAKVNALFGKATGKVGALVFQVNGGTQIMKEKPAKVSNPNTDAQIEQRAKLKLMSQIAAALSPIIGFVKKGLVSARNQFVSANIGHCTFLEGNATFPMANLDLTGSIVGLPEISVTAGAGNAKNVALSEAAPMNVDAILYANIKSDADDKLLVGDTKLISTAGADRTFPGSLSEVGTDEYIVAYGLIGLSAAGGARYENYIAILDESKCDLGAFRNVISAAGSKTKTKIYKVVS